MIAALASLRLTLASLGGLIAWLWWGAVLAGSPELKPVLHSLNQQSLPAWLAGAGAAHPLVAVWLTGFLALSALLAVNLLVCTVMRLTGGGKLNRGRRRLVMVLHLVMLAVMLAHGASFVMGVKHTGLRLLPGQGRELPGGLRLRLESVTYGSDPAILAMGHKQTRPFMTREAFSRHRNFAEISVRDREGTLVRGRIFTSNRSRWRAWGYTSPASLPPGPSASGWCSTRPKAPCGPCSPAPTPWCWRPCCGSRSWRPGRSAPARSSPKRDQAWPSITWRTASTIWPMR